MGPSRALVVGGVVVSIVGMGANPAGAQGRPSIGRLPPHSIRVPRASRRPDVKMEDPRKQLRASVRSSVGLHLGHVPADRLFVSNVRTQDRWASGTVALTASRSGVTPVGFSWLAYMSASGKWRVGLEGSPAYRDLMRRIPAPLADPLERQAALHPRSSPLASGDGSAMLSLPWATGATWYLHGGPHDWNGTADPDNPPVSQWNSIDLRDPGCSTSCDPAHGWVTADRGGVVHRDCATGYVRITHGDGWFTTYYHLINIQVSNNQPVARGQILGQIARYIDPTCGGSLSNKAHVHFSLWHTTGSFCLCGDAIEDPEQHGWNGVDIGGWTVHAGATQYAGYMQRDRDGRIAYSERSCSGCNYGIYNDGSVGSGLHTGNLLANAGFELGTLSGWHFFNPSGGNTYAVPYNTAGRSKEGTWFLEMNETANGGSAYQDVSVAPQPGQTYSFSIWARVPTGAPTPYSLQLTLWGVGGTKQEGDSTSVSLGNTWQLVTVSLSPTVAHSFLRAQMYLHTPGLGRTIDFDGATFASGNEA